jgi:NAD(P)-dependent dehydrogenase (short-subunit alcohol dehydrogenase family)
MFDFSGRVVMVAGAAGNLGEAVTRAFGEAGARLALLDHDPDRLAALYPELAMAENHLLLTGVDAADEGSVAAAVGTVLERLGRIDVLANTVGGWRGGAVADETSLETWELLHRLNARTSLVLSRAVVPAMLEQGSGKIVHTAARAALAGGSRSAAYSASKAAVVRLVESLAAELGPRGINVNCVLPGTIDTPQNRAAMPKADPSRWVAPGAIAQVFLFLASDAAWAINGAAIPAYGRG